MNKKLINLAYKYAEKANKKDEVPVGCIIVKDNKVIAKAFNKKEKNKDATSHAEIIAIKKASKKLKTWRLSDCDIYVTLQPCNMCYFALVGARIQNIYYGAKETKTENLNIDFERLPKNYPNLIYLEHKNSSLILKNFFENKRNM